ncbi:putative C2 domain, phosphoribosyltransferase [Rosa chinensis]|uniref:Putative C2 domain, phosphoribosyltransferase n=1 Tax=Rosa chinensis TaxID=74649 RepID=A0A2P6QMT9_ROSCH|nr:FT-interacting protein 7 [Rosa chinensis]PRQ35500.1 putative C2 domain, phosphoribosyltransferase [Rosa chinensis]
MANQKKEVFSVKETKPSIRAKNPLNGPTTSFDLVEEMLYLYVRIEKARLLVLDHSVLQVELKIGNYRGAATTEANPQGEFKWNRVFAFTKSRLQDTSVQVLVKDGVNVVGQCSFGVSEAEKRVPPVPPLSPQWYALVDQKRNAKGELMMAFWTGTQADEVYNSASHSDEAVDLSHKGLLSIRPSVYYTPRLWYLRVNVIGAQDLVLNDINNREQPAQIYVKARVLLCELSTRACLTKTADPKWNEDLMFVVAEPFGETLDVGVFELKKDASVPSEEQKKYGKYEVLLGSCEIPLKNVGKRTDRSPASSPWYDLTVMEGEGMNARFASKINMRISLDGGYHVFDEPTEFSSDLRPSSKILWKPAVGMFELGIMSASGLSPIMPNTSVDAFCVAKYGPKWVRTRTVVDNCSPKWNEQYMWEVYDHCTVITIAVFQNKYLLNWERNRDREIGKVRIRLSNLEFDKVYTNSHPLVSLEPYGVMKRGELQLSYRFCSTSKLNVYHSYTQALWPKLHYVLPLSVAQIHRLRPQAVKLTESRLQKAESPLSPEVVQYVLDDNKHKFSLRRAKANFLRCMKLLECFSLYRQRFDRLRKWTNPLHNAVFIISLIEVTWFPWMALASMFFMLSGIGAWGYWKRPKQLPHIDTELSQVYSVHPDEIAEEFDSFPTSASGNILTIRYHRLQGIILNVQTTLGDIATTGERVQSLLSWRDKKATLLALIFFFFAGMVFYIYPFSVRSLVFWTILYMTRHPMLRIDLPSYFHNFIRRMPSKIDSML